ncbi:MAG: HAMP domain-containing sensor histidine kinase [Pseudomonadota bacterium]
MELSVFMQRVHTAFWLTALLVLLLEVVFIFRPLARDVALSAVREREALAAARERDEMAIRKQMFGQIAHDLCTSISVISGYAEALRDGAFGPIDAQAQRRYIDRIATAAQHQAAMAHNLGALARVNSLAEDGISEDRIDVAPLMRDCAGMLEDTAREAGVTLSVVDSDLPIVVGDSRLLQRVIVNLLTTAIRYGENHVLVAATSSEKGGLDILVADGRTAPSLADPGREIDDFDRIGPDGVGMGLSVCRDVMAAHGGVLRLARNAAEGVTAMLRLPPQRVVPA